MYIEKDGKLREFVEAYKRYELDGMLVYRYCCCCCWWCFLFGFCHVQMFMNEFDEYAWKRVTSITSTECTDYNHDGVFRCFSNVYRNRSVFRLLYIYMNRSLLVDDSTHNIISYLRVYFLCTTHNDRTHCSYELVYRIMLSCSRFLPVSTVCYFASFDPICQYIGIGGNTHKSQFPHRNYWHVDRDGMIRSSTSLLAIAHSLEGIPHAKRSFLSMNHNLLPEWTKC